MVGAPPGSPPGAPAAGPRCAAHRGRERCKCIVQANQIRQSNSLYALVSFSTLSSQAHPIATRTLYRTQCELQITDALVKHSQALTFREIHNMAHVIYPNETLRPAPQTPPPPPHSQCQAHPVTATHTRAYKAVDASNASSRCKVLYQQCSKR